MELLDTALEKAADIVHMDEKAAIILLYPMQYAGLSPETSVKRIRTLEGRLMALNMTMGYQFAIPYDITEEHSNENTQPGANSTHVLVKESCWHVTVDLCYYCTGKDALRNHPGPRSRNGRSGVWPYCQETGPW